MENINILLFEDDEGQAILTKEALDKCGFNVDYYLSAKEGLENIGRKDYAVYLIDIKLADMSGMEVLQKLKQARPDAIAIMVTGHGDERTAVESMRLGAFDYIVKSPSMGHLTAMPVVIEEAVERYKLHLEKSRLEQDLKDAQGNLIQAAKMSAVGQLGAGLAHTLNNPIGGILGFVQFLLEKANDKGFGAEEMPICKKYLQNIQREGLRCKEIIDTLLKFSKVSTLEFKLIDLKELIKDTTLVLENQLSEKNIEVETEVPGQLEKIMGNASQLQQVLANVLINSIQSIENNGKIWIRLKDLQDPENKSRKRIEVELQDNGCGIIPENMDKVFEPFFTTKKEQKALGLGLTISYRIIQDHRGQIKIQSQPQKGTTVTITLPVS